MTMPSKPNSLQTYQVILYGRALHPELFPIKSRKVCKHNGYELEMWMMPGAHLLRFERKGLCACELVTDQEGNLPTNGIVTAFLCAGEHEFEHTFTRDKVTYMITAQTEALSENLYISTFDEMGAYARENNAVAHRWSDEAGKSLSVLDIQTFDREVHVQAWHLMAAGEIVLRTQTIFEHH